MKFITRISLVLFLLAFLLGGMPLQSARAASVTVNSTADPGTGGCDVTECTLREAIAAASAGDTIDFDASLSGGTINLGSTLTIDKTLIIDASSLASPVTIDGGSSVRVFYINSGVGTTLENLTIQNGSAGSGAGVFISAGGSLTLTDSSLASNSATSGGGGIYNNNGTVTITDTLLTENSSSGNGGAILTYGALTITDSTLSLNTASADTGAGGAINIQTGTVTVTSSTLTGNTAKYGGGITNYATLTVTNSTFEGNSATSLGGGIYAGLGTLTVLNSTLSENSAGSDGGGGIYNDAVMNYSNTIIAGSTSGGDCGNDGTISTNINNLVQDGTCSATYSGDPLLAPLGDYGGPTETMALLLGSPAIDAGDYTTCTSAPVNGVDQRGESRVSAGSACDIGAFELGTCIVTTADDSGSGSLREKIADSTCEAIIFNGDYTISLASSLPTIGRVLTISGIGHDVTVDGGGSLQVFIINSAATVTFDDLVIADGAGGSGAVSNAGHLNIQGITFQGNNGTCNGGAILNTGTLEVDSSLFTTNQAVCAGGALYNNGGTVTISLTTFDSNSSYNGGAILNQSGSLTITDSTFTTNTANTTDGHGGAVYNNGDIIIQTSTLLNNSAADGGAIMVNSGTLTLVNSTLNGNSASDGGGGIYSNSDVVIDNNTFAGNTAAVHGAGLNNNNGTLNFSNNIFSNSPDEDCYSPYNIGVNSHNFIQDGTCSGTYSGDPLLAPLADYGGPTKTMGLQHGSPAIDAGDYTTCTSDPVYGVDQRGKSRISAGSTCDIGAFEGQLYPIYLPLLFR